ncbi:APA family fibronectin-binding glycoprotein [Mycobacteroides franklinii]|uniref:APA family fibronectin-binding glycoprotein n=1 Tax=Mycobacteroides franklinii TaxID=948102 RepID=UPI0012FFA596|nr:APA family fibronectin-binding glycoprotein [Mycobacteroides franklinii]
MQRVRVIAAAIAVASALMAVNLVSTGTPLPTAAGAPARISDDKGKFSFAPLPGWIRADAQRLTYGTTLLTNAAAPNSEILLGPLEQQLFAGFIPSYPDNRKAAIRLASDLGNFLLPYTGNRLNWDDQVFTVNGLPAASAYYDMKFDDAQREDAQIWAGVVGYDTNRFFILWRGSASSPIDRAAAQALTESIEPY